METVQEHYDRIRDEITDGCLFLISKNALISKTIRWCDSSEYSHIGEILVKEVFGKKRILTLESNPDGLRVHFFSNILESCDKFTIIKPLCSQEIIEEEMWNSLGRAEKKVKYDFFNGIKEGVNRKFNTTMKITRTDGMKICSDSVRLKAINQRMIDFNTKIRFMKFEDLSLPFPQDYLRYRNKFKTKLL